MPPPRHLHCLWRKSRAFILFPQNQFLIPVGSARPNVGLDTVVAARALPVGAIEPVFA